MCVAISLLLTIQSRPRLNMFGGPVYSVGQTGGQEVCWAMGIFPKALEMNGKAAKWRMERLQMSRREERRWWAPSSKCLNGCGCMPVGRTCAFSVYLLLCKHVSVCVWVRGGNRWEVCHVLVNKSVIVLFCPAWVTVSCAGSNPLPPSLRSSNMHARAHIPHTHIQTDSRTHPIMRTKTDSVLHRLVACNWIGASSVIFPIWWPDAPHWRGICSLVPCHGAVWVCSRRETWPEGLRGARTAPPCCTQAFSKVSHTRCPRTRSSVTLPNNNSPSTPWLFTFWKG